LVKVDLGLGLQIGKSQVGGVGLEHLLYETPCSLEIPVGLELKTEAAGIEFHIGQGNDPIMVV
jgi:hypothetical protein